MKIIFQLFSYSAISLFCTLAFASNSFTPYRVIGVECVRGNDVYCRQIPEGEYKGYWLKSNVPFDSNTDNNIRPNMFTKAVLDRELKTLDAQMQGLSVRLSSLKQTCEQTQSPELEGVYKSSPFKPYKVVGVSCTPGDLYCEPISSGPFSGYYIKSNVKPKDADFNKIRPNMFTKAALNREKEKRLTEIKDLGRKYASLQKHCGNPAGRTPAAKNTKDAGGMQ